MEIGLFKLLNYCSGNSGRFAFLSCLSIFFFYTSSYAQGNPYPQYKPEYRIQV